MFESLSDRLQNVFQKLGSKGLLTEDDVREGMKQVRLALLEADVNYKVVKDFVARVTEQAIGEEVLKSLSPDQQVVKIVNQELINLLGETHEPLQEARPGPTIITLVGLQGTGKTTLAAKLALLLRKEGKRVMLAACDVYRPAAINQLQSLGKQLNIPVYSEGTDSQPPDIARRALEEARQQSIHVLIIDTAGRLQIDDALMLELEDIDQAVNATERLLVVDAMTGQEAVKVADTFNERIHLTGLAMTKMDGDARGGAALSVRAVTGLPIKFLSTGEKVDGHTLEPFYPDRLASRILGMGDILSLIERAEHLYDEQEAKKMEKKLRKGKFDFEDFLNSMQQMRKLGPMRKIMEMIPGVGQAMRDNEEAFDESRLKRVEAMIFSMTPYERRHPEIIKRSRRERIARGSGSSMQEVNALLKQFQQMQLMMKKMAGGKGGKGGKGGRKGGGGDMDMDPQELLRMLNK